MDIRAMPGYCDRRRTLALIPVMAAPYPDESIAVIAQQRLQVVKPHVLRVTANLRQELLAFGVIAGSKLCYYMNMIPYIVHIVKGPVDAMGE